MPNKAHFRLLVTFARQRRHSTITLSLFQSEDHQRSAEIGVIEQTQLNEVEMAKKNDLIYYTNLGGTLVVFTLE